MSDDIVTRMRSVDFNCDYCQTWEACLEAADEIERLRNLMKAFVSAWERSELNENNGTEYFNAVHAMREAVRCE